MRRVLAIVAILSAFSLSAQILNPNEVQQYVGIRKRLATPLMADSTRVIRGAMRVQEVGDAATIINKNLWVAPTVLDGYRIVIFMENSQTARREAVSAQRTFAGLHMGESSYLSYEAPYFKVTVGNFTSQEEAAIALNRIQKTFPNAFVAHARINIKELAK